MSKAQKRKPTTLPIGNEPRLSRRELLAASAVGLVCGFPRGTAAAQGQLTWAAHLSLAPTRFDPAETSGIIAPFMVLYALHDALVKPMPGQLLAPSLAESWSAAKDGLSHDFVLREGVTFHNGEPVTTDDVKFSFERYRGTSHDTLKSHTASVDVLDQRHVRFRMKEPWPDFMPFTVPPPERPGSCQGNIWKRSATMVSKGPRSAPAPTGSSRLPPGSSWWPRRSIGTGARRPTSSAC